MIYRNKKTGTVIRVKSEVTGEHWEKMEEAKKASSKTSQRGKKNG